MACLSSLNVLVAQSKPRGIGAAYSVTHGKIGQHVYLEIVAATINVDRDNFGLWSYCRMTSRTGNFDQPVGTMHPNELHCYCAIDYFLRCKILLDSMK